MNFEEEIKTLRENVDKYVSEITEKIEKLKKQKEEAEKPKDHFWKTEKGQTYLFIRDFEVEVTTNTKTVYDNKRIESANCYSLDEKEIAEKDAAKLRARQIIQRTADKLHRYRYEYIDGKDNYLIGDMKEVYYAEFKGSDIYFESIELAEECRDICKNEYEILLG